MQLRPGYYRRLLHHYNDSRTQLLAGWIVEFSTREHVTPCLQQLHWLYQKCWCVQFKLCCIMHSVFYGTCPAYLMNIVESIGGSRTRSGLRLTSSVDLTLPRLCIKFSERAFSHAVPATWNTLLKDLRAVVDPAKFQKRFKMHYFTLLFNVIVL